MWVCVFQYLAVLGLLPGGFFGILPAIGYRKISLQNLI
jgi:hypothetical protein